MSDDAPILVTRDGAVGTLTLNRPSALNVGYVDAPFA